MMFSASDAFIVTIDFGSTVNFGEQIPATTPDFSLDVPPIGSPEFDLVCLASTLLKMTGESPGAIRTRETLLQRYGEANKFAHRAAVCLCQADGDVDQAITSILSLCEAHGLEILHAAFPHPKTGI